MPIAKPFAFNTGSTVSGTIQIGSIAIAASGVNYQTSGLNWYMGPDEDLGFIICKPNKTNTNISFYRSTLKTEASFINLTQRIFKASNIQTSISAVTWLNSNGYYTTSPKTLSKLNLKAFLQGPYDTSTHLMKTTLNTSNLIPKTNPYTISPWNYTGSESVYSIPANVVDWVFIDIRQGSTPANAHSDTSIFKKVGFIKSDGTIVDIDGSSKIIFDSYGVTTNLYPIVYHRNHLPVMPQSGMTLSGDTYTFDLTKSNDYGNGVTQVESGVWAMIAGDADANKNINTIDYSIWVSNFGKTGVYIGADFDMSGEVTTIDWTLWGSNFGNGSYLPS